MKNTKVNNKIQKEKERGWSSSSSGLKLSGVLSTALFRINSFGFFGFVPALEHW